MQATEKMLHGLSSSEARNRPLRLIDPCTACSLTINTHTYTPSHSHSVLSVIDIWLIEWSRSEQVQSYASDI